MQASFDPCRYIIGSDRAREARAAGFGAPGVADRHQPHVSSVQRHLEAIV